MIRAVKHDDAAAIAGIYNWYIANTVVSFETEPVSVAEMEARIEGASRSNPWLVLEDNAELLGYAYAARWKSRAAYSGSKETSVYLRHDAHGLGYGYRLMEQLIQEIGRTPIHTLIAGIALPNEGSVALHEKLGFRKVGVFRQVGNKFDGFVDVGYWQLNL